MASWIIGHPEFCWKTAWRWNSCAIRAVRIRLRRGPGIPRIARIIWNDWSGGWSDGSNRIILFRPSTPAKFDISSMSFDGEYAGSTDPCFFDREIGTEHDKIGQSARCEHTQLVAAEQLRRDGAGHSERIGR